MPQNNPMIPFKREPSPNVSSSMQSGSFFHKDDPDLSLSESSPHSRYGGSNSSYTAGIMDSDNDPGKPF